MAGTMGGSPVAHWRRSVRVATLRTANTQQQQHGAPAQSPFVIPNRYSIRDPARSSTLSLAPADSRNFSTGVETTNPLPSTIVKVPIDALTAKGFTVHRIPQSPTGPQDAQLLDALAHDLDQVCGTKVSLGDRQQLIAILVHGLVPAHQLIDTPSEAWCRDLASVYTPFWASLRQLERDRPGIIGQLGALPTPSIVSAYVERASGQKAPRPPLWTPHDQDGFFARARVYASDAVDRLHAWLRSQHRGSGPRPVRIVGPQSKRLAQSRTRCAPERTFTIVVRRRDSARRHYCAYLFRDGDTKVCGKLEWDPDGSPRMRGIYTIPARPLLPAKTKNQNDAIEAVLREAIEAVHSGRLDRLGLSAPATMFDLPASLIDGDGDDDLLHAPRRTAAYGDPREFAIGRVDECDLVALADALDAESGSWARTQNLMLNPKTRTQKMVALQSAQTQRDQIHQLLAPGVLQPDVAALLAANRLSGVCDGNRLVDRHALYEAAPTLGLDVFDPAYKDRDDMLCADVRAVVSSRYL